MSEVANFELLLREALSPIDPPEDLVRRVEDTLTNLAEIAAEELESWELSSMRDPRNWVRPAAAVIVGTGAGGALVLLRARRRQQMRAAQATGVRDLAQRTVHDAARGARRLLDR